MSAIERWNLAADGLVGWAQGAAVTSLVMLAAAGLVWLAIRRRASAHLGHLLFLVPLVPLALPGVGTIELPAWIATAAAPRDRQLAAGDASAQAHETPLLERAEHRTTFDGEPQRVVAARAVAPTWKAWAVLAWALSVAGLALRFLFLQLRTDRLLVAAPELAGHEGARVRAALERLAPRLGLRRTVRVVACDAVPTPAVWGVRRPTLALGDGVTERLDERQLDWVLLHELAHVARRDLAIGCLQRAIQILWFFHPLVWLAGRAADELREAACDEAALALSGSAPRRACAEALVELAARRIPRSAPKPALLLSLQNDKTLMKKRILRLLDPRRVPVRRSSPLGVVLLVGLAGASLVDVNLAQDPDGPVVELQEDDDVVFEVVEVVGDEEASLAVDRSLAWLLAQQAADGHWPTGPGTEADTGELSSIGVTGLVLLALHEAPADDARAQALERGRAFLASVQDDAGLFGRAYGHRFMQSHAVATLAWLKTRAARPDSAWRPQAERAVAVILRARNPYKAWRLGLLPEGDNDTFITGLMLAALNEARAAGIEVPERAWAEPLAYVDAMTEPANGRTGYDSPGGNDARLAVKGGAFPAELTQLSTAMALTTRLAWGQDPSSPVIRRGAFLVSELAPRWDVASGGIDYYYWLFGTRALRPIGGSFYASWREALLDALVPNQLTDASGGWWPAIDAWGIEGTSVHATVVCTLALQAAL